VARLFLPVQPLGNVTRSTKMPPQNELRRQTLGQGNLPDSGET